MDTNYLKLTGKVNIPEPLLIGTDYHVAIKGSISGKTEEDNHDGTHSHSFKFEPLTVEILTPQGQTLKADKYKQSVKMRMALRDKWATSHEQMDFVGQFYF